MSMSGRMSLNNNKFSYCYIKIYTFKLYFGFFSLIRAPTTPKIPT